MLYIAQTSLLEKELVHLGEIIRLAAACKKPDSAAMEVILVPLSKDIEAVTRAKEQFRKDRDWNGHHTVLAEGATIVGWVAVVSLLQTAYNALYSINIRPASQAWRVHYWDQGVYGILR